jgi:cytochrome c-type biogenesis protein CcmH/NrfG
MQRALDREPTRRQPSTREFAAELHAAIATMPMTRSLAATGAASPRTRVIDVESPSAPTVVAPAAENVAASGVPTPRRRRLSLAGVAIALGVGLVIVTGVASRGAIRRSRARTELEQGIAAYRQGRSADAMSRLRAASADAPGDPRPHVYLSRLAREGNDLTTASSEGVTAVRLAPNDPLALRELATTLYAMENFNGARAFYVRAVQADRADHTSQGYLGCALIRLGRTEEGTRWLERAGRGTWSACGTR